jgi:pilus assembly protein CpaB
MKRRLAVKLTPAKVTMLMLVAVASLIGMYVIKGLFAVEKKVARPQTVNIPLATAYLAPGTKITDTHIGLGPFPANELKEDHLRSARVTVGRVVKKAIQPGSPIRGSELYEPGENSPLEVAEGKQAISINPTSPTVNVSAEFAALGGVSCHYI